MANRLLQSNDAPVPPFLRFGARGGSDVEARLLGTGYFESGCESLMSFGAMLPEQVQGGVIKMKHI